MSWQTNYHREPLPMPVHDWSRFDAGIFHSFHSSWITHLMEAMNGGLLPDGYYALSEQHAGVRIPDIITLPMPGFGSVEGRTTGNGGIALVESPPLVRRRLVASSETSYRAMRRTLAIRHTSRHRLVAMVEIASPGNKDRQSSVDQFAEKVQAAIMSGVHVLLVDVFSSGKHDPLGLHGAIWTYFDSQEAAPPEGPVCLASYLASRIPEAYLEYLRLGDPLTEMPLFLEDRAHVKAPLETTYLAAFRGMPRYYRDLLEAG